MKMLVTGACGFAGSHLTEFLLNQNDQVTALAAPSESTANLSAVLDSIDLETADLTDRRRCSEIISAVKPDVVFHLAAIAFLPDAAADPARLFAVNLGGVQNLADAVITHCPAARFLLVSSGEVYGQVSPEETPTPENHPLRPANPYAHSKVFAETLLFQMHKAQNLNLVVVRPFTHIGPRQRPEFAASNFARQIAQIEKGGTKPVIRVGNLDARRDITDVKDMMRAYKMAAMADNQQGPFNIGSGEAVSISSILDELISLARIKVQREVDPARLRPSDVPVLAGDCSAFEKATGWQPRIPLRQSLEDLLNYWRSVE